MATSRLDAGAFSASDIQTMARVIDLPVDKVRRLTEMAVLVAGLDRASRPAALDVFTPWLALAIDDHALAYPANDSLHYDGVCSSDCAGDIARRYTRLASEAK